MDVRFDSRVLKSSTSICTVSRPGSWDFRAFRRSRRRPEAITVLPWEWKWRAKASPMPEVAPRMRIVEMSDEGDMLAVGKKLLI